MHHQIGIKNQLNSDGLLKLTHRKWIIPIYIIIDAAQKWAHIPKSFPQSSTANSFELTKLQRAAEIGK